MDDPSLPSDPLKSNLLLGDQRYLRMPWEEMLLGIEELADLVIADPVYENPDLSYLAACIQALKPGGALYVFGDDSMIAQTKVALDTVHKRDVQFQNWLIMGPQDWGGRSSKRWGQKHDDILYYTRRGAPHTFNAQAVGVPKATAGSAFNKSGRDWKIPNSVWNDISVFSTMSNERVRVNGQSVRWQKPEAVIERIVLASSNPGELVVDPFGGVATVPAVCRRLGRRCLSSEIDPDVWAAGDARLRAIGAPE